MKTTTLFLSLALVATLNVQAANDETNCRTDVKRDYSPVNFVNLNDGTVKDLNTGLIWSLCTIGQNWDSATQNCIGEVTTFATWGEALVATSTYSLDSQTDWRVPNIKELESIVDRGCSNPSINTSVFPNTPSVNYYSSTPFNGKNASASNEFDHLTSRIIDFSTGHENPIDSVDSTRTGYAVRPVRCGQWPVTEECKLN